MRPARHHREGKALTRQTSELVCHPNYLVATLISQYNHPAPCSYTINQRHHHHQHHHVLFQVPDVSIFPSSSSTTIGGLAPCSWACTLTDNPSALGTLRSSPYFHLAAVTSCSSRALLPRNRELLATTASLSIDRVRHLLLLYLCIAC